MSYILHTLNMIGQGPADGSLGEFILGGSDYGRTDTADIDRKVKARLVPAIKHPKTGEIYTGLRGEDHKDVMRKHGLGWRKLGLSFDSIEHTGYYDRATKKFYSHREAGFHSTDLMTPSQRFRKYGSESIVESDYHEMHLPISELRTALPRSDADESKVSLYRHHLRTGKTIKPVHVVSIHQGGFDIVDGQHRYWAHQDENKATIPARVYNDRLKAFKDAHGMT